MIVRSILILASLFVIAMVGTFLFYVSALAVMTAIVIAVGLFATMLLGYLAGCNSTEQTQSREKQLRSPAAIVAPGDVTFFPEMPVASARSHARTARIETLT